MPIVASDLKDYKSINTDSDGGAVDTAREITSGVDNNLFPDITGAQAAAGGTDYRKVFRKNTHATLTWSNVISWITQQPSGVTISVGIGINHADDADSAQGNMTAFSASAKAALVSDGADTRTVTVLGEDGSGTYISENVVLNGAVEVLSVATFAKVYAFYVDALSASRTVTLKQGAGGTTRGTIGINKKISWLWRTGTDLDSKSEGYRHGNIAAAGVLGLWLKRNWPAATAAVTATSTIVKTEGDTPA